VEDVVRGDDPGSVIDRSGSPEQFISPPKLDWVDPKVTNITSAFRTETSIANFLDRVPILKADTSNNLISVEPYSLTEAISLGRSSTEVPFFYMYSCLFANLHVSLPFNNFTMDVLQALNVAPTQLHPNTWASIQVFRLICNVLHFHPTPSCFLSYSTSHSGELVLWHSLISRSGNVLFSSFNTSYKNFKEKFFMVFIRPKGVPFFFVEVNRSSFPMFWTRKSQKFKEWPRST